LSRVCRTKICGWRHVFREKTIFFLLLSCVLPFRHWRTRNFDWEGPIIEKSCNVSLVTVFGDVITMTSLKLRHNWFFEVRFCHNPFEKPQFGKITQIQVNKIGS